MSRVATSTYAAWRDQRGQPRMQSLGGGIGVPWAVGDSAHTWYLAYLLGTWSALGRQTAHGMCLSLSCGKVCQGLSFMVQAPFSGFCKSMNQDRWLHSVDLGGGRAAGALALLSVLRNCVVTLLPQVGPSLAWCLCR